MSYFLNMLSAFAVLLGLAYFIRFFLKMSMGQALFTGVITVAAVLYISSFFHDFRYGIYVLEAFAATGGVCFIARMIQSKGKELLQVFSPSVAFICFFYLASLILLHNDFIQHIDELHHWALAVREMLLYNRMPQELPSRDYAFATSLFHLFFQKFSGYNEQSMYVSGMLFCWIGFLLPFSEYEWKDWKKVIAYCGIIYISLYSLYVYGMKSIYVDVPLASWAGGLIGWIKFRTKKKSDFLFLPASLVMLHFIKSSAGLLMAVFVVLYLLFEKGILTQWINFSSGKKKKFYAGSAALFIVTAAGTALVTGSVFTLKPVEVSTNSETEVSETAADFSYDQQWTIAGKNLPERLNTVVNTVRLSKEKVIKSFGAFVTKLMGSPLASRSTRKIPFFAICVSMLILMLLSGEIFQEKDQAVLKAVYLLYIMVCYTMVVFLSYLFMFSYELSINMRSVERYFSICAIFAFVFVLTELLRRDTPAHANIRKYLAAGIAVFFAFGLNTSFIPNATALQKTGIAGYEKLISMSQQIDMLNEIMDESDKVYYLCQISGDSLADAELYNASLSYYMGKRASDYLWDPWRFYDSGCNIRLEEYGITIEQLPDLLAQGGYTYLWVHTTNKYLNAALPEVLDCPAGVSSGYLYKVIYQDGTAVSLEYVNDLTVTVE